MPFNSPSRFDVETVRVEIYHHLSPNLEALLITYLRHQLTGLDDIKAMLAGLAKTEQAILQKEIEIMAAIDDLEQEVASEATVVDSVLKLMNSIPGLIAAAGTDPKRLLALQQTLKDRAAAMAAAVVADTPAATTPTP